jgi:hypothetical protein
MIFEPNVWSNEFFKEFPKYDAFSIVFRCKEHFYKRLRWSVGPSVGPSVPHDARLRGKLVTSRLLREEEEEEETDYVAIPLRRDSITSRFFRT